MPNFSSTAPNPQPFATNPEAFDFHSIFSSPSDQTQSSTLPAPRLPTASAPTAAPSRQTIPGTAPYSYYHPGGWRNYKTPVVFGTKRPKKGRPFNADHKTSGAVAAASRLDSSKPKEIASKAKAKREANAEGEAIKECRRLFAAAQLGPVAGPSGGIGPWGIPAIAIPQLPVISQLGSTSPYASAGSSNITQAGFGAGRSLATSHQ